MTPSMATVAMGRDMFDLSGKVVLVNCAGIQHRETAMEFPLVKWDQIISLMLPAVFELCQQAGRVLDRH